MLFLFGQEKEAHVVMGYVVCLGLSILTRPTIHPPKPPDQDRKPPNLMPVTVGGGFRSSKSEIDRSVGESSHEQPNPTDPIKNCTSLKCKSDEISIGSSQISMKSSQISMRSIQIRPNLNQFSLRSGQLWPPSLLHQFRLKPTLSTRLKTESNHVFRQSGAG